MPAMNLTDIGDGLTEATCEAEGCNAKTHGRRAHGWPENEGWTVTMDDTPVFTTASYHFFCPAHIAAG